LQEQTLAIIKPDAFSRNLVGPILAMAAEKQLSMVAAQLFHLSRKEVESFYYVHQDKSFFESLIRFMTEGPIFVMVLQGEKAITVWREIMGATNPSEAKEGTIRQRFGESIERNAVHGSDTAESAHFEIGFFFSSRDLLEGPNTG
jgi:nucleoside-diphosphate kinase